MLYNDLLNIILTSLWIMIRSRQYEYLNSVSEFDWAAPRNFAVLAIITIISRLPLINLGFGLDNDAWRVANTAFDLRHHLVYHASRFPGYPFTEFIYSLVIEYGWIATNSLTLLITIISGYYLAKILRKHDASNKGLILPAYLFTHMIWINSANSMDFMWALSFIIICWYLVTENKYKSAGMILGLAVASRFSSILFLFPVLYLFINGKVRKESVIAFLLSMTATIIVMFLPVVFVYQVSFLTYYPGDSSLIYLISRTVAYVGLIPFLIGVVLFIYSSFLVYQKIRKGETGLIFPLSVIIIYIALFIFKPYDKEYLLPVIPFGLIVLGNIYKRTFVVFVCALLLANIYFIDKNIVERKARMNYTLELIQYDIPSHSVVILGGWFSMFSYINENVSTVNGKRVMGDEKGDHNFVIDFEKDIVYRYIISEEELRAFQRDPRSLFYTEDAMGTIKSYYGYDLKSVDAIPIVIK